jgi:hypothetical protein
MNPTYSFSEYRGSLRLVYSDWSDRRFTPYFDITERMFTAIKSPIVVDTFWKWATGKQLPDLQAISHFGDNTCRIQTPIPHHFVYLIRQTVSSPFCPYVCLEEVLPSIGSYIEDKMDVTSFGRLVSTVRSISELPQWRPDYY